MNIIRIDKNNQVNGAGLRCVVWISGCENRCPQCHNPETWDYKCGHKFVGDDWDIIAQQLSSPEISGVTLTGGDPLAPGNRERVALLCDSLKRAFPNKTIWVYTGHLFEEIKQYLNNVDVLIDGKYDPTKNPGLGKAKWRGSRNQRVIDVKASLARGEIVLWRDWDGTVIDENH